MRLLEALKSATEYLEGAGIEDAFADAEILTFHAAGTDRLAAYMENPEIPMLARGKINRSVRRRGKGEPIQYIVGSVEFLGLTVSVGRGVLIPRPETELLAEEAIKRVRSRANRGRTAPLLRILDLCTGSGCIALALAKALPDADVWGTDVSKVSLRFAKKNAAANAIENVSFFAGSLFAPLPLGETFDLIISNPPYVASADIPGLQREIRDWEPPEALDGGADGLNFYRKIFSGAVRYLRRGGYVMCELGFGQADLVTEIAQMHGFSNVMVKNDFAGVERILQAEL